MLIFMCMVATLTPDDQAAISPSPADTNDIASVLLDVERDGSFVPDPLDGQTKAHLVNREHQIRSYVDSDGTFTIVNREDTALRVNLRLDAASSAPPTVGDDSVAHDAAGVHQRWLNGPDGIEHTITLDAPLDDDDRSIRLKVHVSGLPFAVAAPERVVFEAAVGPSFGYGGLKVFDANGEQQTAWFDTDLDGDLVIAADLDDIAEWPITIDPIATTFYRNYQDETGNNNPENNHFGAAMAIGDFNHDGIPDLAVAGNLTSNPESQSGQVTLFSGSQSSPLSPMGYNYDPHTAGRRCGFSVAAGDFDATNGDDLVILCAGSPGLLYFLNTPTGLPTDTMGNPTPTFTQNFASGGVNNEGEQITAVGDFKGDGKKELVVGVRDLTGVVKLEVFTVDPGGLSATEHDILTTITTTAAPRIAKMVFNKTDTRDDLLVEHDRVLDIFEGDATTYLRSTSSRTITDFSSFPSINFSPVDYDGDGASDLLIGNPSFNRNSGEVIVEDNVNGTGTFQPNPSSPALGLAGEALGTAVLGADLNHDLHDDLVMCGGGINGGAGGCRVFPGAPRSVISVGFDVVSHGTLTAPVNTVGLGNGVPVAGDFTGDGAADVVVPHVADLTDCTQRSPLQVDKFCDTIVAYDADIAVTKGTATTPFLVDTNNSHNSELFGQVMVMADVNGDGLDDVIVGAPGFDAGLGNQGGDGAVFAWAGNTSISSSPSWTQIATAADGQFGSSIAVGRFFSSTGPIVVAIGAPAETPLAHPAQAGSVHFFAAASGGFPANNGSEAQPAIDGVNTGDNFGTSLTNAGSLVLATSPAGDSLAVGAPQPTKHPPSLNGGYVKIFRPNGSSVSLNSTFNGNQTSLPNCESSFGQSLSNVGNVDGANRDDLVVGAPSCHVPDDGGAAFLLTSNAGSYQAPSVSSWTFTIPGGQAGALLGQVVAGLGDTTGDGAPDFAVAAPLMDSGHGRIYVFNGKLSGLPNTTQSVSMSASSVDNVGSSIAPGEVRNGVFIGHDVNRDGFMDMIEGEPAYNGGVGRVRVFLGKPGALNFVESRDLLGTCTTCNFGTSVALGDLGCEAAGLCPIDGPNQLTHDGYAEAAVGQPGLPVGSFTKVGQARVYYGQW
jgi:hypothetical protein